MRVTATVLFLASGLLAVLAAPDKPVAFDQFALLCAGLGAAWALVWLARGQLTDVVLGSVAVLCGWLAGALGGYYLLSHDWATGTAGFAPFQSIGLLIQRFRPSLGLGDDIHDNVLAGALVLLISLGIGGIAWLVRAGRRSLAGVIVAAATCLPLVAAFLALALSGSRGGWLGLLVGGLCGSWWVQRRRFRQQPIVVQTGDVLAGLLLASVFVLFVLTLLVPGFSSPLDSGSVGGTTASRAALWRDGLTLIGDYRFTGSGFASTPMVLSSYVYLLHVGFLTHLHNLYLEVALEQGLPGLIALSFILGSAGWSLAAALRTHTVSRVLAGATAVALVAMAVHGLVDAGLYVSRLAALLFLPVGFAWAMAPQRRRARQFQWDRVSRGMAGALAPLAVAMVVFAWPGARAAFHANLGAVSQTTAELARYSWPAWPVQDALRRSPAVNLEPAIERYALALALDPSNLTAYRRLGQIVLSRGDYAAARQYLEAAYARAPEQRATRLLLGEVYALTGQVDQAAALWRGVDTQPGQLDSRAWWVGQVGTPQQIEWFQQARQQMQADAQPAAQGIGTD